MRIYKETIAHVIVSIFVPVVTIALWIGFIVNTPIEKLSRYQVIGCIIIACIGAIKILGSRKNRILIYKNKISIFKFDIKKKIADTLAYEDIYSIKLIQKFTKKVEIKSIYKKITISLRSFRDYTEILKAVVEGTKNNNKIHVDKKILELIGGIDN